MDIDIYNDLDPLDNQYETIQQENEQLKTTIEKLEDTSIKFCVELKRFKKIKTNLEQNITTLFKTAKAELERKNSQIAELRKNLDNVLFKRGPKGKLPVKNVAGSQENEIKQFQKTQSIIDNKNRIIQSLNAELANLRKELEEKQTKRNSSHFDEDNERNFKTKRFKGDREPIIENEEEYRNYRNRYERWSNGFSNSRSRSPEFRKNNYRGPRNSDLRSQIDLKRINYRRSRSKSTENHQFTRCNKQNYRNTQYSVNHGEHRPPDHDQDYYQHYREDEKHDFNYEQSEHDSGVCTQTTESSSTSDNIKTELPIPNDVKESNADCQIFDEKNCNRQENISLSVTPNKSDEKEIIEKETKIIDENNLEKPQHEQESTEILTIFQAKDRKIIIKKASSLKTENEKKDVSNKEKSEPGKHKHEKIIFDIEKPKCKTLSSDKTDTKNTKSSEKGKSDRKKHEKIVASSSSDKPSKPICDKPEKPKKSDPNKTAIKNFKIPKKTDPKTSSEEHETKTNSNISLVTEMKPCLQKIESETKSSNIMLVGQAKPEIVNTVQVLPADDTKNTEIPEISIPEISVPEISIPEISIPEISIPEISIPEIRIEDNGKNISNFSDVEALVQNIFEPDVSQTISRPATSTTNSEKSSENVATNSESTQQNNQRPSVRGRRRRNVVFSII